MKNKGFTLIELMIVIAIIGILSGIVMFAASLYINKAKDSNIKGNLVTLIPAGEVWYNINQSIGNTGYEDFCDPDKNTLLKNMINELPLNEIDGCENINRACLRCNVAESYDNFNSWVAWVPLFSSQGKSFCVDSRGMRGEFDTNLFTSSSILCP